MARAARDDRAHFEPSVPPAAPGAAAGATGLSFWSSGPPEKTPAEGIAGPDE